MVIAASRMHLGVLCKVRAIRHWFEFSVGSTCDDVILRKIKSDLLKAGLAPLLFEVLFDVKSRQPDAHD